MLPTAKIKKKQGMLELSTLEESSILPKTKGNKIIIGGITEDSNGWATGPTETLWYSQVQQIF